MLFCGVYSSFICSCWNSSFRNEVKVLRMLLIEQGRLLNRLEGLLDGC